MCDMDYPVLREALVPKMSKVHMGIMENLRFRCHRG